MERPEEEKDHYLAYRKQEEERKKRELDFARETIRDIYIQGALDPSSIREKAKAHAVDSVEETGHQLILDAASRMINMIGTYEIGIEAILMTSTTTPEESRQINLQALQEANEFWTKRLSHPDLNQDEILFGQKRGTDISGKLEQVKKDLVKINRYRDSLKPKQ